MSTFIIECHSKSKYDLKRMEGVPKKANDNGEGGSSKGVRTLKRTSNPTFYQSIINKLISLIIKAINEKLFSHGYLYNIR